MTVPIQKHLMSEKDAARILNLAPATLRTWRHLGRGPTYTKVGHSVGYSAAAVTDFIERGTVTPGVAA